MDKTSDQKYIEWMYRWIRLNQEGIKIEDICKKYGFINVAIYGFNLIGKALLYELKDSDVNVEFIIDRNKNNIDCEFKCIELDELSAEKNIDAIILCVRSNTESIIDSINSVCDVKVITFEDLIYEL